MPLNVFDATFRSFEQRVLPEVRRQGIAPLGMKSLCGSGDMVKHRVIAVEDALRYAMSLPVTSTVSGIDSMKVLKQNIRIASNFTPMTRAEMDRLRFRMAPIAADDRFELFKTTAMHDADEGAQHGFPPMDELAG
jgi:hypothetical protein